MEVEICDIQIYCTVYNHRDRCEKKTKFEGTSKPKYVIYTAPRQCVLFITPKTTYSNDFCLDLDKDANFKIAHSTKCVPTFYITKCVAQKGSLFI
jgi:hypothetical protein